MKSWPSGQYAWIMSVAVYVIVYLGVNARLATKYNFV